MTNRVEFELEITGLKLKVKGTKESAAQISSQVSNTIRGLISPPSVDEEGVNGKNGRTEDTDVTVISSSNGGPKRRGPRKQRQQNQIGQVQAKVVEFKHDAAKYSTPTSKWKTADKAIWLLYILSDMGKAEALSTPDIVETFNTYFKQAKTITTSNVTRDLGKKKIAPHSYVGEDVRQNPSTWYLTDEGQKYAQRLIVEQKSQGNGIS